MIKLIISCCHSLHVIRFTTKHYDHAIVMYSDLFPYSTNHSEGNFVMN